MCNKYHCIGATPSQGSPTGYNAIGLNPLLQISALGTCLVSHSTLHLLLIFQGNLLALGQFDEIAADIPVRSMNQQMFGLPYN